MVAPVVLVKAAPIVGTRVTLRKGAERAVRVVPVP